MNILAIERELPARIPPGAAETLRAETAGLWDLHKRGLIRQLWSACDGRAILLLEAANAADARHQLATLPMVQTGRVEFSLIELRPYDALERLFEGGAAPGPWTKPAEPPEY
jgi:muconolactone delta-isomerase